MKYIELTIHTTTEASEIISDIMWQYTDYGVTICDRADIIALQTAKESIVLAEMNFWYIWMNQAVMRLKQNYCHS